VSTVNIVWNWGTNSSIDFNPATDILDFGWFAADQFTISEVNGTVVIAIPSNHQTYTLQNTTLADLLPYLKARGVGVMNAAPFSARLLTNAPLPPWHKATDEVRAVCRRAAQHCTARGSDIAQLALQYSLAHPDMATCVVGSANPRNVEKWVQWADQPPDQQLLGEVLEILRPIRNWFYVEGRPENNDPPSTASEPRRQP